MQLDLWIQLVQNYIFCEKSRTFLKPNISKKIFFSQLPAIKKDAIFGVARKIFGPSYFVMAFVARKEVTKSH